MKRFIFLLMLIGAAALNVSAQNAPSLESLQKQMTALQEQLKILELRIASVEQLNLDLRKAVQFGTPITTATDRENDIAYNIISVKGSKADRTIKITFQVVANSEAKKIYLPHDAPYIINLEGKTKQTFYFNFDNGATWTVHPEAPVLAYAKFENVNLDDFREIKLLNITPGLYLSVSGTPLKFTDLMVEWE